MLRAGSPRKSPRLNILGPGAGTGTLGGATSFYAPLTNNLSAWGLGSTTPTFSRTSTAYVQDHEGIMRQVLTGEARFWGARRVQNLYAQSQDMTNAAWTNVAMTVTAGDADPFGGTQAQRLTGNDVATPHQITQFVGGTAVGNTFTMSRYLKTFDGTDAYMFLLDGSSVQGVQARVNLNTGAFVTGPTLAGAATNAAGGITAVGGGWYRCWLSCTFGAGATANPNAGVALQDGTAVNLSTAQGIICYGNQLENVTGQSVVTPSEYVSTNVLSLPYYGANVDGVQYFDTVRLHTQNLLTQSENVSNAIWTTSGTASKGGGTLVNLPAVNDYINQTTTLVVPQPGMAAIGAVQMSGSGTVTIFVVRVAGGVYEQSVDKICTLSSTPTWFETNVYTPTVTQAGYALRIVRGAADTATSVNIYKAMLCRSGVPSILTGSANYTATTSSANLGTDTGTTAPIPSTTLKKYLPENAVTNLCPQPTAYSNVAWAKTDIATGPTDNSVVSPTGELNASTWTEGSAGTAALSFTSNAAAAGSAITFSAYVRLGAGAPQQWVRLLLNDITTPADGCRQWFNLSTGTVGAAGGLLGAATGFSSRITALQNGWYRCEITCVPNALSTQCACFIMSATADGSTTRVNSSIINAWVSQFEVISGCGATSPIPVAATPRSADLLTYTVAGNVDGAQGSFYAELTAYTSNSNSNNTVDLGSFELGMVTGVGQTARITDGTTSVTTTGGSVWAAPPATKKVASAWGGSTKSVAITGGTLGSGAFDGSMNPTLIRIGPNGSASVYANGGVGNVRIYNQKLTDAQLTAMVA